GPPGLRARRRLARLPRAGQAEVTMLYVVAGAVIVIAALILALVLQARASAKADAQREPLAEGLEGLSDAAKRGERGLGETDQEWISKARKTRPAKPKRRGRRR